MHSKRFLAYKPPTASAAVRIKTDEAKMTWQKKQNNNAAAIMQPETDAKQQLVTRRNTGCGAQSGKGNQCDRVSFKT
jgi:hypothetical protein